MRDAELPSEVFSNKFHLRIMKKNLLAIIAVALFVAVAFTSCETATAQGAGWGAATGALLGGLTSRHSAEGAAVGALIGANTGALIGASIDEAKAVRYGRRPRGGFLFAHTQKPRRFCVRPCPPLVFNILPPPPRGALVGGAGGGVFLKKP